MQQEKRPQIWVVLRNRHKVKADIVLPCAYADGLSDGLTEACQMLDIERPVLLPKHQREWMEFRRTSFSPRDFIGDFPFDQMEIEYFEDAAPKEIKKQG